jgi:hypothetical protein
VISTNVSPTFHLKSIKHSSYAEGTNMDILTGPVLRRADGYALNTSAKGNGMTRGYPCHPIEAAHHARNAQIVHNAYLAAKNSWLQRQLQTPLKLGDPPFVVGRRSVAGEGLPPRQPNLILEDTKPFRLSRNHFLIEQREKGYYLRDLRSTLGTIVNGQPIGDHFATDDVLMRAGENEVIAGGVHSPFVFSVFIPCIALSFAMTEGG